MIKVSQIKKAVSYVLRSRLTKRAEDALSLLNNRFSNSTENPILSNLDYEQSPLLDNFDVEPEFWRGLDKWETPSKYMTNQKLVPPGVYHASSPVFGNIPGTQNARHSQILAIMNRRPMTVPYVELDNGQFGVNYSGGFGLNSKDLVTSYPVYNDKIGNTKGRVPSDLNALTSYIHPEKNKYYTYTTMQSGEPAAQNAAVTLHDRFKQHQTGSGQYNPFTNNCNSMCAHAAGWLDRKYGDVKYPKIFGGKIGGVPREDADRFIFSPNGLKYPLAEPKVK